MLESLFNKVARFQISNFIKKKLQHKCFPLNFAKFLRMPILKNIWERLLLAFDSISHDPLITKLFVYDVRDDAYYL